MNRMLMAAICLMAGTCVCAMGMGPAQAADADKPMLDGKTFAGTLTSKADGKTYDEKIIFEDGMIRSTACEAMGFKAGPYTATKEGDKTMVKGSVKNDKGEINEIEATIEGKMITGTLTSKSADGTVTDTMTLNATKVKAMKEGEHPGKSEHPTKAEHPHSEHPR